MNRQQSKELARWLAETSGGIQYGEVSVKVFMHSGHVHRIVRSIAVSQLPDQANTDKLSESSSSLVQNKEHQTN